MSAEKANTNSFLINLDEINGEILNLNGKCDLSKISFNSGNATKQDWQSESFREVLQQQIKEVLKSNAAVNSAEK